LPTLFAALVLGIFFAGRSAAQQPDAGSWAVGSAPARFSVEIDKDAKPAPLTYTSINVPDPRWVALPIRVFDDSGQAVGSEVVSTAPGQPTMILFDSSSDSKHYDLYFGATDWPPLPLKDDKEGVWLESRVGDGREIDKLPDLLDAWNKAKVEGRAVVPGIFEGGNRFGPQKNLLLHFTGYFTTTAKEHLDFAIMSTDSTFVLVDGKEVVEWPGGHDWRGGMQAQHQGGVDLDPGKHTLDYYNDYFQSTGPPLLACLAVKGGPMDTWQMMQPNNPLFTPTNQANVMDYAAQGSAAPALVADYAAKDQSVVEHDNPDLGFITLTLTCYPAQDGTVTWLFDDGTTATGQTVDHLFPRPGLRAVQMQVTDSNNSVRPSRQVIDVHPDWHLLTTTPPDLHAPDKADILSRDPATFSPGDIAGCFAVFGTYQATDGLMKLLPAATAQMKNIADADLPYMKTGILALSPDLSNAAAIIPLLRALADRCGTAPALAAIGSWARLNLAQLLLLTSDKTDEVQALVSAINPPALEGDDHRRFDILRADLLLATGKIDDARKLYQDITGDPSGPDARSGVRQTGRIGQARVFLDRGDLESAEDAMNQVAWESPNEKLDSDWELTRLRLYQAQKLPDVALIYAKRLLPVITGGDRSELLFQLTQLAADKGDHDLAGKILAELLQKHAYSEEAAKAKAKWPGGV
jgi:hypothetical protein